MNSTAGKGLSIPPLCVARLMRAVPSAARLLRFVRLGPPRERDVRPVIDGHGRMVWERLRP